MKILQINSVCGIRSTGRICTDIADVARQQGHECLIAYGREMIPDTYANISIRTDSPFGVKSHALQSRIFDNAGFARKKATKNLIRQIENFAPDIIHLHNLHGYYINVQVLFQFLKEYKRPVVWTLHDCWAFTGHCTYFDRIGCYKWKDECGACPQKCRYPASYMLDNSRRNFLCKKELFQGIDNMVIVTPSQWLASLAGESFLKKYPIQVIHNGIDLGVFKPTESDFKSRYGLQDKKIVLGVASCFDSGKGFDDFIMLSNRLKPEYTIVLVGLTQQQIDELPPSIVGIERTNSTQELAEIYSAADVFVNPTYEDNFPTTNLEAQSCGTPTITYRTGGSVESVPNDQVVAQGDVSALLDKIYDICENQNYSIKDRTPFDKQLAFEKYIQLYENIL